jgi:hypothetical protein
MSKRGLIFVFITIWMGFTLASSIRADIIIKVNPFVEGVANDSDLNGVWDSIEGINPGELFAYNGGRSYNYKSITEFSITGVLALTKVDLAILTLSWGLNSGNLSGKTLRISGYADDGLITLDDYNRAPDPVVPLQSANRPPGGQYQLDVTPFIQSLVDQGQPYAEFVIDNAQFNQTIIHSNQNPNPSLRPLLSVTVTTPLPAGLLPGALIGLSITGYYSLRRNRLRPR